MITFLTGVLVVIGLPTIAFLVITLGDMDDAIGDFLAWVSRLVAAPGRWPGESR